jgi:hypothetical protein
LLDIVFLLRIYKHLLHNFLKLCIITEVTVLVLKALVDRLLHKHILVVENLLLLFLLIAMMVASPTMPLFLLLWSTWNRIIKLLFINDLDLSLGRWLVKIR